MALTELSEGAEGPSEGFGGAIQRGLGANPKEPEGKPKALEIFPKFMWARQAQCRPSHGRLKAEGLAVAWCHGLSASPQCREVGSMGYPALCAQPLFPGSNPAKVGIASQPRDVK